MEQKIPEALMLRGGFQRIAKVEYGFKLDLWWHPEEKIEISIIKIDRYFIVKGRKSYVMRSISHEGEVYVRDLNAFQDYLKAHFPEVHISFSHFRDIESHSLIIKRIKEKKLNSTIFILKHGEKKIF